MHLESYFFSIGVDFAVLLCYITFCTSKDKRRGVEQLVARRAHNPEVVGSSPSPATSKKPPNSGGFCVS